MGNSPDPIQSEETLSAERTCVRRHLLAKKNSFYRQTSVEAISHWGGTADRSHGPPAGSSPTLYCRRVPCLHQWARPDLVMMVDGRRIDGEYPGNVTADQAVYGITGLGTLFCQRARTRSAAS